MQELTLQNWTDAEMAKFLKGWPGLMEWKFIADNVQQRPLGFKSGESEFTFLFWATKKGGTLIPKEACQIASKRKQEIQNDKSKSAPLWLALD